MQTSFAGYACLLAALLLPPLLQHHAQLVWQGVADDDCMAMHPVIRMRQLPSGQLGNSNSHPLLPLQLGRVDGEVVISAAGFARQQTFQPSALCIFKFS